MRRNGWSCLQKVRDSGGVTLYEYEGELYVLVKSQGRQAKDTAIWRKPMIGEELELGFLAAPLASDGNQ